MRRMCCGDELCLIGLAVVFVMFVAFEVGVRMVTPDTIHYRIVSVNYLTIPETVQVQTGTLTDAAGVAKWRAGLVATPIDSLWGSYLAALTGVHCNGGGSISATALFTWHGLPVEVASPGPDCSQPMVITQGWLPDFYVYSVDYSALLGD